MCIVLVKPFGVKFPKRKVLKRCWEANSDGAGIMYPTVGGRVQGTKGFMEFDELFEFLHRNFKKENLVVIHFRTATHGGVNKENTHPFPCSDSLEELRALEWTSDYGIAHNGIIKGYGTSSLHNAYSMHYDWATKTWIHEDREAATDSTETLSDTQDYIRKNLSSPEICGMIIEDAEIAEYTLSDTASKWVILDGQGNYRLIGKFHEQAGVFYSNDGYKPVGNLYGGYWAQDNLFNDDYWSKKYWDNSKYNSKWDGNYTFVNDKDSAANWKVCLLCGETFDSATHEGDICRLCEIEEGL